MTGNQQTDSQSRTVAPARVHAPRDNTGQTLASPHEQRTNGLPAAALETDLRDYAIFALDAHGRVTSWNSGAQRIKGYATEEIIGRHFSVFYPAAQVKSGFPDWELRQAEKDGFFIDRGWRLRKDGSRFWAHVVITAQRDTDGHLDGFIKVTRDDSSARQRSHRRFTDLFELAPVGTALIDQDDRVLDANRALHALLGYPPHGKTAAMLMHQADAGHGLVPRPFHDNSREPMAHRVLARSNGQPVHCKVHCAPSISEDGDRFWLVIFQDITEQIHRAEALHHQATHDHTTGLLNRQGVDELLAPLLDHDRTNQRAVLFCDLDNFKRVNDSLGHDAGDELLAIMARRLEHELPGCCTPARLYGDEFLIICSDLAACGGLDILTAKVADILHADIPLRSRLVSITASLGAVTVEHPDTTTEDLLRAADAAMFEAKRGHGRMSRSGPNPVPDLLSLEEDLREALHHDHLQLHYQPIMDRNSAVVLAEALLRWPHPHRGLLAPDTILRIAEKGGLLPDLDRWVLRTALSEAAQWQHPHRQPPGVAINLSGLSPDMPHFTEEISAAITTSEITPDRVVLEMVETSLVDLPAAPRENMRSLTRTGVRFAMDDFGTGYSSLARLKDLPTQILKLDQRFVSGMGTEPADLGIARAVVELARAMGRTCIAEGVEHTTQHSLLTTLGVDGYQGFLFSPALPPEQFRKLLGEESNPTT